MPNVPITKYGGDKTKAQNVGRQAWSNNRFWITNTIHMFCVIFNFCKIYGEVRFGVF